MKLLNPVNVNAKYIDRIEREVIDFFSREIYKPLILELKGTGFGKLQNSSYDLITAINKGRVSFYRGHFKGKFNAKISKELKQLGAVWDSKHGSFRLPTSKLPLHIRTAIFTSESSWLRKRKAIETRLASMDVPAIVKKIDLTGLISKAMWQVDKDFEQSVSSVTIAPKLSEDSVKHLAENYTQNMQLYIQDFTVAEIVKLRETVEKNVFAGNRYESLAKKIEKSYGVSKSKATFLARQETKLLVSKFKETRYNQAGVTDYIWTTVIGSPKHPVRERHKFLAGKRFRFDSPPIVNEKGDRKNPSEDYGCRCTARPVVEF